MPDLPTGTVTFLFTDIEGSTALLRRLGDRYAGVLAHYRQLLRETLHAHEGQEVDTQGDALLVVFARAKDGVSGAVSAQRKILTHKWPAGVAVRVRMGLHTGEPLRTEAGYVGMDVHRAVRICSAAHGGQILLSQTTLDLTEQDLPEGTEVRDLGEYRLKDLTRSQRLFQLVAAGLPSEFPPPRTLDRLPNNLPVQLTSFVGREKEKAEVERLLRTTRLLTLTGAGGAGKTRLAQQAAADLLDDFKDGVWFVDLAPISEPPLVPHAVATAMKIPEQQGRPILTALSEYLQPRQLLLILDNCEHLLVACAGLANALLRACPHLKILTTSRQPLDVEGETTWRVPSLPLPDVRRMPSLEELGANDAVRLFAERSSAALPEFRLTDRNAMLVAKVCSRLDGIPLAIELAAARVRTMSVERIVERLDDRFRLLATGGRTALPRHRTLRGAMDWSYDLLSEAERAMLRRLSVFAGGFTLDAAEGVCVGDSVQKDDVLPLLTQLVDKSLVVLHEHDGTERYRLLETVRQYAADKLAESGETTDTRRRHRDWYLTLAQQADAELRGPTQGVWIARLEAERDNVRAALAWSLAEDRSEAGLWLAGAMAWFWVMQASVNEGREWLEKVLSSVREPSPTARAKALNGAGIMAWRQGDLAAAERMLTDSLDLFRQLGEKSGMASSLHTLAHVAESRGEYDRATTLFEDSVALCRGRDNWELALTLNCYGRITYEQGDFGRGKAMLEESRMHFRARGDRWALAYPLRHLGIVAINQNDLAGATAPLEESLAIGREVGDGYGIAAALSRLGDVAIRQGNLEQAVARLRDALTLFQEMGFKRGIVECFAGLAAVALRQNQPARAAKLLGAAEAFAEAAGIVIEPVDRIEYEKTIAAVRAALGDPEFARVQAEGKAMTLKHSIEYALRNGA